ncbi:glycosyltransferase family protein isoform X2 [Carex rostrata]
MERFRSRVGDLTLLILVILAVSTKVPAIRTDISFPQAPLCKTTVQGRYLISDNKGYVCTAPLLDSVSRCCPLGGERFSCQGCNLASQCCNSYEYCVSCCLDPSRTREDLAMKVKIAKPVTAGTYASAFDYCAGRCRHNSASVVHENAYASDFHHCFSLHQNSSEPKESKTEASLTGIDVLVGRPGESCESVCRSRGQSCLSNMLSLLNQCDILQKYMRCKNGCYVSMGADQPAEVAEDAPSHLNPGACLYTQMEERLFCEGSHQHTRRLCPCA